MFTLLGLAALGVSAYQLKKTGEAPKSASVTSTGKVRPMAFDQPAPPGFYGQKKGRETRFRDPGIFNRDGNSNKPKALYRADRGPIYDHNTVDSNMVRLMKDQQRNTVAERSLAFDRNSIWRLPKTPASQIARSLPRARPGLATVWVPDMSKTTHISPYLREDEGLGIWGQPKQIVREGFVALNGVNTYLPRPGVLPQRHTADHTPRPMPREIQMDKEKQKYRESLCADERGIGREVNERLVLRPFTREHKECSVMPDAPSDEAYTPVGQIIPYQ